MANEAATAKDAQFVLINILPDVCLTPSKSGYPVPYVITHKMDQSEQCSPNVFFRGKPAYLHNESYVDNLSCYEARRRQSRHQPHPREDQPQHRREPHCLRQRPPDHAYRRHDVDELQEVLTRNQMRLQRTPVKRKQLLKLK